MSAPNTFVTGIGGFTAAENADGYIGAAGQLPGAAEFVASVMFMARPNYSPAAETGILFGNSIGAPAAGWDIAIIPNEALQIRARAADDTAGLVSVETPAGYSSIQGGIHIATMRLSVENNELALFVDGVKDSETFDGAPGIPVYVPSAGVPTVGFLGPVPDGGLPVDAAYILGCAYTQAFLTDEQIWRHQQVSLEAGDIVDGNQGGAYSAGVPSFTNLWSARRGNAGIGAPLIVGEVGGITVGQVPRAAPTWAPAVGGVSFARVDSGATPKLFVTGLRQNFY